MCVVLVRFIILVRRFCKVFFLFVKLCFPCEAVFINLPKVPSKSPLFIGEIRELNFGIPQDLVA